MYVFYCFNPAKRGEEWCVRADSWDAANRICYMYFDDYMVADKVSEEFAEKWGLDIY